MDNYIGDPNCPICHGDGFTLKKEQKNGGERIVMDRYCECYYRKQNEKRLKKSGLYEVVKNKGEYKTPSEWQKQAKEKAIRFLKQNEKPFFYISGITGSGKTHLCTLMCKKLLESNFNVLYVRYATLKSSLIRDMKNNNEKTLEELRRIDVLYIDDLFKTNSSDFMIDNLFEIIDYRAIKNKMTILSSEKPLSKLFEINEEIDALVGRIVERSGEFVVNLGYDKSRNYRLK